MWKPLAEERAAKIALLEKRLLEREESAPPPWPTERTITVILTVHGDKRIKMALEAYRSIIAAGFKPSQIRICLTSPPNGYGNVNVFPDDGHVADMLGPIDNNAAWLQSCERSESSHIIILHDDDLMKPGLAAKLKERDDWEVAYWDAEQIGDVKGPISYFHCKEGVYSGALVEDLEARLSLTISTIQGCYPRHTAVRAFERWQREFSDSRFYQRPGMAVGNDTLIWVEASRSEKVWIIREPFSQCRHHPGSNTVAHLNGAIEPIYADVRKELGLVPKKVGFVGHLPKVGGHATFLAHLSKVGCSLPLHLMSKRKFPGLPSFADNVVVDDLEGSPVPSIYKSIPRYQWSIYAFANACLLADQSGYDFMCYIEDDCRMKNGWELTLRDEAIGSCRNPWQVGTPCLWNMTDDGDVQWVGDCLAYAEEYRKQTGLVPAMEGIVDNPYGIKRCLFANGAFAFFSKEAMEETILPRVRLGGLKALEGTPPYDIQFGEVGRRLLGRNVFQRTRWMGSLYSGCGDHWMDANDRLKLFESGQIVAVHQVKS